LYSYLKKCRLRNVVYANKREVDTRSNPPREVKHLASLSSMVLAKACGSLHGRRKRRLDIFLYSYLKNVVYEMLFTLIKEK
jgi:hypothetical protein